MSLREIVRLILTWASLVSLYLLLTGQASLDELIAAAFTGAAGAALSAIVRLSSGHSFLLWRRADLRPVVAAIGSVPRETLLVGVRLVSPQLRGGDMISEELPQTERAEDRAAARAVRILATSFAPNRFVVRAEDRAQLWMHRLVARQEQSP